MSIVKDAIKEIAHLARLEIINSNHFDTIQEDLNRIMGMVDQIVSANTNGIEPMAHPLDVQQPLRPDNIVEDNQRELLLASAPKTEAGLYLVPVVIE